MTTSYAYNGFGELASMTASFGATPLYSETYTRDALGRIVTRVETIQGVTTTYEYGYDAAGRLETVTKNGTLASQYAYDANGNRLAKQTPTTTETGTYDAQDRMLTYAGASYTYTANGETLTKTDSSGTTSYQYDVFGNFLGVALPNGTQIRFKVDGRNRRIERSVNGVVTQRWLWQGQLSPIAELSASNAVVSRFVYATRVNVPDYMVKSGATYRILHDHLGSPRLAVNATNGAVAQRMDFDEWGIGTTDTNPGWQPFGFGGSMVEAPTGTVRFGSRDYVAAIGRWLVRDPIDFASGSSNLFAYVNSVPMNLSDIDGLAVGHHYVPRQVFENVPELSEQAIDVFENATTGGPIPGGHYYNRAHREYTSAVKEFWDDWLAKSGLKASELETCDAEKFLEMVKESNDPRVRNFLDDIAKRLGSLGGLASLSRKKALKRLAQKAGFLVSAGIFAFDAYEGGLQHAVNEAVWPVSEFWIDE